MDFPQWKKASRTRTSKASSGSLPLTAMPSSNFGSLTTCAMPLTRKVTVKTAAEVKAILGEDLPSQDAKIIDHIDAHCRDWIERCPFVAISSTNAAGAMDASPKGDPPGFVNVLNKHTLAIPDRIGSHRGDTFWPCHRAARPTA